MTKGEAKAASGAAKALKGCGQSFALGTSVLMAGGRFKPIQDVKVGDKVIATDPQTGKHAVRTVLALHLNRDSALTDLTVRANGHNVVIHTTQHHPVWDSTKRMWVGAGDFAPGDAFQTATSARGDVVSVTNFNGAAFMYDLTVDITHTFYVLAGTTPVLVHNCDPSDELLDMADANLNGTNVAAEVVAANGARGWGVSAQRSVEQLTPRVRVSAQATKHHLGCAEIGALCFVELGG